MLSILRIFRFAIQNTRRNFWLALITVSMLVLTLLTINILIILNNVTHTAIAAVEQKIEVSVYFEPGTSEETIRNATGYLRGLEQVKDVQTVTAAEALERFKERHADDETILSSLDEIGENPFVDTLVITANSVGDFSFIIEALNNPQFSDSIRNKNFSDYETIIDKISGTTTNIRLFGIGLSLVFLIISILIIVNTVRIATFVHREEIGIMKLVGASDWFVKGPFLVEAVMYSFIATLIAAVVIFPVVGVLEPRFDAYLGGNPTHLLDYFIQYGPLIFGAEFLASALINMASSAFAMRKYLKV